MRRSAQTASRDLSLLVTAVTVLVTVLVTAVTVLVTAVTVLVTVLVTAVTVLATAVTVLVILVTVLMTLHSPVTLITVLVTHGVAAKRTPTRAQETSARAVSAAYCISSREFHFDTRATKTCHCIGREFLDDSRGQSGFGTNL